MSRTRRRARKEGRVRIEFICEIGFERETKLGNEQREHGKAVTESRDAMHLNIYIACCSTLNNIPKMFSHQFEQFKFYCVCVCV